MRGLWREKSFCKAAKTPKAPSIKKLKSSHSVFLFPCLPWRLDPLQTQIFPPLFNSMLHVEFTYQMILKIASVFVCFCSVMFAAEEQWSISSHGMNVPFSSWQAEGAKAGAGVLVLVPGYNGKGEEMLDARWKAFATKNGLVLLAPTFHAKGNENNEGKGYYYPEQGSGEVMEMALAEVKKRTGVTTDKVLFFGFSAGAHYGHRFALWKPQRVKAFVAYSAGWWSEPTGRLKNVPGLVMCGEADERYAATFDFFKKGQRLGCPWVWRSYKETGHVLTSAVRDMAEVFLAHYAVDGGPTGAGGRREEQVGMRASRYGDIQTYRSVGRAERETIPEEFRIELPSAVMAEVWENE
jgi:poly(3-hydroxybutyrate) depolymerase